MAGAVAAGAAAGSHQRAAARAFELEWPAGDCWRWAKVHRCWPPVAAGTSVRLR